MMPMRSAAGRDNVRINRGSHAASNQVQCTYLEDVDGGVEQRGQRAGADVDVGLHREVLVPDLDLGELDAHQVEPVAEPAEQALVVVLDGLEHALHQLPPVARVQVREVHLAGQLIIAAALRVQRPAYDAPPHAVVRGQLLQRRPPQVLLVVPVVAARRRPTERVVRVAAAHPQRPRDGRRRHPASPAPRRQRDLARHRRRHLVRRAQGRIDQRMKKIDGVRLLD
jgi:hypothetical protein